MSSRELVIERLVKLQGKLSGKGLKGPLLQTLERCPDPDFHLAGLFLKEHMGLILEALRRLD